MDSQRKLPVVILTACVALVLLLSLFRPYTQLSDTGFDLDVLKADVTVHESSCPLYSKQQSQVARDLIAFAETVLDEKAPCQHSTSINETAQYLPNSKTKIVIFQGGDWSSAMVDVALEVQAYDDQGTEILIGGDEFVLTFWGWFGSDEAFKTSVPSTDLNNGSYRFKLRMPRVDLNGFNVTLMHYYTCFEGWGYSGIQGTQFKGISGDLNTAPITVTLPDAIAEYLQAQSIPINPKELLDNRPACPANQEGADHMSSGLWIESNVSLYRELSVQATWEPFCCKQRSDKIDGIEFIRIGSSTMPSQSVQVGDVYDWNRPFHERWVDFLENTLPTKTLNDTLLFSAGLHQLLYGYNTQTAVELVRRMICQIAAVFPGKLIFLGPCPIQQQRFQKIDMTDQQVLLFSARLRTELDLSEFDLGNFCQDLKLDELISFPNTRSGEILSEAAAAEAYATQLAQQSSTETALKARLAAGHDSIGRRQLLFADIYHFLRPRPETYRESDKIHDMGFFPKGMLFFGQHSKFINDLLVLRSLGGI